MNLPTIPSKVVLAPMAGGPGTPELAAAVSNAGGLGFLPAGYLTAGRLEHDFRIVRRLTKHPFGVNVFVPAGQNAARLVAARAYAERVAAWAQRAGLPTAPPAYSDDDYEAKIELLLRDRPDVVSFTFGLPDRSTLAAFQSAGIPTVVTVNTPEETVRADEVGVDALVVQGAEAGAHQGGWLPTSGDPLGLLPLLQLVHQVTTLPILAAGGIANGSGIAGALAAGAEAVMLGTAFLRCTEAGTTADHATALDQHEGTILSRAFTGRPARAIPNNFIDALGTHAPAAYPEVHLLTAPLRAEARRRHDPRAMHLWAGQAHSLARKLSAAELLHELTHEARLATERLNRLSFEAIGADDLPPRKDPQ